MVFGVVAYAIAVWLDPESPVGIRDLISVEAAGTFFGNLTPMMVGGTPAQIYRLTKAGQPVGEAGATQFTRYIVFQVRSGALGCDSARGALAVLHLALRRHDASVPLQLRRPCGAARSLRDLALPALRDPCRALGHRSCRARGGRERSHARLAHLWDTEIYSFSEHFKHAAVHLSSMGVTLVVTMAQLACLYMVPYFVLRAFGNHDVDFISVLRREPSSSCSHRPFRCRAVRAVPRVASRSSSAISSALPPRRAIWSGASSRSSVLRSHARRSSASLSHHASIHARWDRLVHGGKSSRRASRPARAAGAPDTPQANAAAPSKAPSRQAGPSRRHRGQRIRQTSGGITVSPSALKRRKPKR